MMVVETPKAASISVVEVGLLLLTGVSPFGRFSSKLISQSKFQTDTLV
jgi:hypothetical protein